MRLIRNKFRVGDLVEDNKGTTGIVVEVKVREPDPKENWWAMSEPPRIIIQYKVRLFKDSMSNTYYQEYNLTMLSTGRRE